MPNIALQDGGPWMEATPIHFFGSGRFASLQGTPPAMVVLGNVLGTQAKSSTTL